MVSPRTARSVPLSAGLAALTLTLAMSACSAEQEDSTSPAPNSTTSPSPAAPTASATPTADPSGAPAESPQEEELVYRDGQYSATDWYGGLPSHQDVTLTVENDTVTAVEITTPAKDETSLGYQQRFAEALPGAIVGRPIDELAVDRLAGSSGCSEGFMNALEEIKASAAS